MKKYAHIALALGALLLLSGCTQLPTLGDLTNTSYLMGMGQNASLLQNSTKLATPYYFVVIHNEPFNVPNGESGIAEAYPTLERMVAKADTYNIKLTIMLSAQWADYIAESPERMVELEKWKSEGHEIAGHHHSLNHGNWDGYTNYSEEYAISYRTNKTGHAAEAYHGSLYDYMLSLDKLDAGIKSGCMNDEVDKNDLPNEIIYDTCSGFANFGEPGTRLEDGMDSKKGINDFVSTAVYNGIERKWLAHTQITTAELEGNAEKTFATLNSLEVYGGATHSVEGEQEDEFGAFLDFLHSKDPSGIRSRTVSEIIEQKLLPEKDVSAYLLETYGSFHYGQQNNTNNQIPPVIRNSSTLCGDGVCDQVEKTKGVCPQDCGNSTPDQTMPGAGKCGDGICDSIESANNVCPGDCQ